VRKKARFWKRLPDPVASYDGLCQLGKRRVPPEEMQAFCRRNLEAMEQHPQARREDDEARRTPVGGMQYR